MKITSAQMQKALTSNNDYSQLGFSMMITRFKKNYEKDPSIETLQKCTDEANAFIDKYQAIMANDYDIISKL